jgi:hypothetical protein
VKQNLALLSFLTFSLLVTNSSAQTQSRNASGNSRITASLSQSRSFESVLKRVRLLNSVSYRIGFTLEAGEFHKLSREALKNGTVQDFEALLKDENPIVRVLALICLAQSLDAEQFGSLAKTLFADDARVKYTNGCMLNQSGTVGEIANDLRKTDSFLPMMIKAAVDESGRERRERGGKEQRAKRKEN